MGSEQKTAQSMEAGSWIQDVPLSERRAVADSRLRSGVCVLCAARSEGHVLCGFCIVVMIDAVRNRKPPCIPDGAVLGEPKQ